MVHCCTGRSSCSCRTRYTCNPHGRWLAFSVPVLRLLHLHGSDIRLRSSHKCDYIPDISLLPLFLLRNEPECLSFLLHGLHLYRIHTQILLPRQECGLRLSVHHGLLKQWLLLRLHHHRWRIHPFCLSPWFQHREPAVLSR